jgi:Flp pilus assembly protein TadB
LTSPHGTSDGRSLARWGTRAQVVVRTTRREFAYRWTAPRSPAMRVLGLPLLLVATLLVLAVGVVAVALFVVTAAVAILVLAVAAGFFALATRFSRNGRSSG